MSYDWGHERPAITRPILLNRLGLHSAADIGLTEFDGFLHAEIILTELLSSWNRL